MKVEAGTVTIVRISDLMGAPYNLDPIRVTLDDIEPGKGRINIECWGRAWASYWGGMGNQTIAQFFVGCHNEYLIGNLTSGQNLHGSRFSADALQALCKKTIRGRRKGTREAMREYDPLTEEQAAELMREVGNLHCDTEAECWAHSALLERVFGPDGVLMAAQATEPNPEYAYLARICNAVRDALRSLEAPKAELAAGVAA